MSRFEVDVEFDVNTVGWADEYKVRMQDAKADIDRYLRGRLVEILSMMPVPLTNVRVSHIREVETSAAPRD